VIVNERLQKTIKASGKRCTELSSEEEAVVFTPDGAMGWAKGTHGAISELYCLVGK